MNDRELMELIRQIEENDLVEAPKNLKEQILIQAGSLSAKSVHQTKKISKNIQLMLYSMKVCAAVACALLLLMMPGKATQLKNTVNNTFTNETTTEISISKKLNDKTSHMNESLQNLSQEIMTLGGKAND